MIWKRRDIARMMDLAVLKPDTTLADIDKAAKLCAKEDIGQLCVPSIWLKDAKELLEKYEANLTTPIAVAAFPHGLIPATTKRNEVMDCFKAGAEEVDFVMNISFAKEGRWNELFKEFTTIKKATFEISLTTPVKVILETCLLTIPQLRLATKLAADTELNFVKTSTGFNGPGATPEAVQIMLDACKGTQTKVKASGGIRDWKTAVMYAEMGCARLGVSAAEAILAGAPE